MTPPNTVITRGYGGTPSLVVLRGFTSSQAPVANLQPQRHTGTGRPPAR